jgi:BspA type Leucine rich repeat region (6 copies)
MIVKPKIFQGTGTYKVRFFYWDVVGGVLTDKVIERYVNAGGTVIAPAIPTTLSTTTKRSPALEFDSWNITTLTNIQQDVDVGAIYKNATDGGIRKTHAFIVVTATTGYTVPVYFNKSDTSTLTISWGDGSADYTTTSSGNLSTNHTYSIVGTYEIKMWISSGAGTYGFGNGSSSTSFVGGYTDEYRRCLLNLFIGDNVTTIGTYGLYREMSLTKLSIPNNITSIGNNGCNVCSSLLFINIPSSITTLGNSVFSSCSKISYITLPNSLITIGSALFESSSGLTSIIIPNTVTSIGSSAFYNCYSLKKVILSNIITTLTNVFYGCTGLTELIIPSTVTTIGYSTFQYSGLLSINIPSTVTSIGDDAFNNANRLQKIIINRFELPSTITTIGTGIFSNNNSQCRIYVPVGSGTVYKTATNWSTYANQIYENTAENRALFGD